MSSEQHVLKLEGCSPVPLAHYLKALGVLRIVGGRQPTATGWWEHDRFFLRSTYDRTSLTDFFLSDYEPTPLVAPWNGGSGFFPKDNKEAINAIAAGSADRFGPYRALIQQCHEMLERLGLTEKPVDEWKPRLLQLCRNEFPDEALSWLDAAYVLTADGPKYPPLLGTGGNDGRLEFTNNFMQRLTEMFDAETGAPLPGMRESLEESLFGAAASIRSKAPIGQFDPGSAGGSNSSAGYDAASGINLWDFVLMLEGALAFASASVKKLETTDPGVLSYPFCVRTTGLGYASAHLSDEAAARSEMWLPLWGDPTPFAAISRLLSEGRIETGAAGARRQARNAVDVARAIASFGIDRGISAFQRYGFHQRNGLSYFAVPLGRFDVRADPGVEELLAPLDGWIDRFRRAATSKTAPARAGRALRNLETAIFDLCRRGKAQDVRAVLIALGEAEATVAMSKKLRDGEMGSGVPPVPLLSSQWIAKAAGETPDSEFRLACALASVTHGRVGPMRRHFEPIDEALWRSRNPVRPAWANDAGDPNIVWGHGDLVRNLGAVLRRRLVEVLRPGDDESSPANQMPLRGRVSANPPPPTTAGRRRLIQMPLLGRVSARLDDVNAFIEEEVNDQEIDALLTGLILVDWSDVDFLAFERDRSEESVEVDAYYGLLKLCHLEKPLEGVEVKLTPEITNNAVAGKTTEAVKAALRRLRASGMPPAFSSIQASPYRTQRIAAALVFPISDRSKLVLRYLVVRATDDRPTRHASFENT